MKIGLHESTWWYTSIDPIDGIKIAKKIGFDAYDVFPGHEISIKQKRAIRETLEENGLKCSALTLVATALSDFSDAVRDFTTRWVKENLDFAYDLEAETFCLPLGEYVWEKQEIRPEIQWNWTVEKVREIGDYAQGLGIPVGLELHAHKTSLIYSVDLMKKFLDDVNHPFVMANADVSHLHIMKDPPKKLWDLKGRIVHVHFSDNNGIVHGDLPPGRGTAPLKEYLRTLNEMGFDGTATIELEFSPDPDKIIEWVTEAYVNTARMMSELGIRSKT